MATDLLVRDQDFWEQYLQERVGTYEFRCIRYAAVLDRLMRMGLSPSDSVADVGAGRQEFAKFLREQGWQGEYHPFDGSIDGTDLDVWQPHRRFDWMIAIEVIEHLHDPHRMLDVLQHHSDRGFAITTPNPEVVDVLAIDRTHVSVIWADELASRGMNVERDTLFGSPEYRQENDSLIGWRSNGR